MLSLRARINISVTILKKKDTVAVTKHMFPGLSMRLSDYLGQPQVVLRNYCLIPLPQLFCNQGNPPQCG